ncbi:MAG TPA: DUF2092 domain-containing protein, partial [Phenylobacterium sp.]|nr:DUF2092 domain-containing protein [Phenylobacterium sp.]
MGGRCSATALAAALSLSLAGFVAEAATPRAAPTPHVTAAREVDPAAVKALREMSAFLQSLSTFKLTSRTSLDLVANDNQKIQLDGTATYRVRKPNAFAIDVVS